MCKKNKFNNKLSAERIMSIVIKIVKNNFRTSVEDTWLNNL